MLETVCPAQVKKGDEIYCGAYCPWFTVDGKYGNAGEWSITRVTRGHFLSPASDDAVLSTMGCEPHSENFGGTILLTRKADRWNMLWYKRGVQTSKCHKVELRNAREILVCIGEYGGQGNIWTAIYLEDFLNPIPSLMAGEARLFQTYDNTATCGYDSENETKPVPLTHAFIEEVKFGASTLSITFEFGKTPMTLEKVKACLDSQRPDEPNTAAMFLPSVRKYHVDFHLDGHDYKLTPSSAAAARVVQ